MTAEEPTGQAGVSGPLPAEAQVVPGWRPSRTLELLEELLDAGAAGPRAVGRRIGLSPNEIHALRHLSREPMSPGDLARTLGVTTAASSGIVDRLSARGHVERVPHPQDGRRTAVVITAAGRHEAMGHLRPMFETLAALDTSLDPAERQAVERYLAGAVEALRRLR